MRFVPQLQVFYPGHLRPVFYVASRGHHADIGGITPGSMPPNSRTINEEGAVFKSFFLVKSKVFQEEGTYSQTRLVCLPLKLSDPLSSSVPSETIITPLTLHVKLPS